MVNRVDRGGLKRLRTPVQSRSEFTASLKLVVENNTLVISKDITVCANYSITVNIFCKKSEAMC